MPDVSAFVDEVANELATWPGVRIDNRADGAAMVRYEHSELRVLYTDRGIAAFRYRDVRGEDDPYSSQDPDYPQGRLDQL